MQEIKIDSCQRCQMYVDIYTTLTVLALLVAPYIYDISRLRVNGKMYQIKVVSVLVDVLIFPMMYFFRFEFWN